MFGYIAIFLYFFSDNFNLVPFKMSAECLKREHWIKEVNDSESEKSEYNLAFRKMMKNYLARVAFHTVI